MLRKIKTIKKKMINYLKDENQTINGAAKHLLDLKNDYKELSAEILARNLVAWENSKDKEEGMLPEVYFKNKVAYEKITRKEFNERDAIEKYYKGG